MFFSFFLLKPKNRLLILEAFYEQGYPLPGPWSIRISNGRTVEERKLSGLEELFCFIVVKTCFRNRFLWIHNSALAWRPEPCVVL